MAGVSPILQDQAGPDLQASYDAIVERFGHVPQFYAMMAHRPAALASFLPFYTTVMRGGTVDLYYKELAYLKASLGNVCAY